MELLTFSVFLAILILIFIIISIGYLIYAFVTNPNFTKRKLAFLALSLSFVLNSLPFFFLGIPDGIFFLIFYLFFIFIIWVIWITFAFDHRTFHIICGGFYLITAIIFTIICIKDGGPHQTFISVNWHYSLLHSMCIHYRKSQFSTHKDIGCRFNFGFLYNILHDRIDRFVK